MRGHQRTGQKSNPQKQRGAIWNRRSRQIKTGQSAINRKEKTDPDARNGQGKGDRIALTAVRLKARTQVKRTVESKKWFGVGIQEKQKGLPERKSRLEVPTKQGARRF